MKWKISYTRWFIYLTSVFIGIALLSIGLTVVIPTYQARAYMKSFRFQPNEDLSENTSTSDIQLKKEVETQQLKLKKLSLGKQYLVINTLTNTFKFYKNNQLVREGMCSTGSYEELETGDAKTYRFETPKGVFTVKGKIVDPVWKEPDWAFVEEGLPIPPPNHDSRFEYGVLGDYALSIGNGYLIHGTLYQRFLGMPVTHGCVRLNDSDLEFIYHEMPLGAKVFIY